MTGEARSEPRSLTWTETLHAFLEPRVASVLVLGIAAGLPLLLIFGTLSVWLREAGVARSSVTFFSWAVLAYSFKYVWAPLVDVLPVPWLTRTFGRRRGWLLLAQLAVIASILAMASSDPQKSLVATAIAAIFLGFSSATQDIVIDAYRIEVAEDDLQALLASAYVAGYRTGMLVAGAGALKLAAVFDAGDGYDHRAWAIAYVAMALVMAGAIIVTLIIREPEARSSNLVVHKYPAVDYLRFVLVFAVAVTVFALGFAFSGGLANQMRDTLKNAMIPELAGLIVEAVRLVACVALAALVAWGLVKAKAAPAKMIAESYVEPMVDFVRRFGRAGLVVLLLIATYRTADIVMGSIANVFYIDLGFTKDQIANVAKTFGLAMTVVGGVVGGVVSIRFGLRKALFLGAFLAASTNLLFALLAQVGPDLWLLAAVIGADNLSMGMASTAFVAYLSSLTNVRFTATQYALFSSIMTLIPKTLAGYSGMMVDAVGYTWFFIGTALVGIPILILVVIASGIEPLERRPAS